MGRGRACGCCSGALSFLGGWQTPFVGVACTLWVGAELQFAATNTTLVQGQGFEDHPQLSKGLIPGLLDLSSDSSRFVSAITGVVHRLLFSLPTPHMPAGVSSGRDMVLQACFLLPFCPGVCACSALWCASFVCFAFSILLCFEGG